MAPSGDPRTQRQPITAAVAAIRAAASGTYAPTLGSPRPPHARGLHGPAQPLERQGRHGEDAVVPAAGAQAPAPSPKPQLRAELPVVEAARPAARPAARGCNGCGATAGAWALAYIHFYKVSSSWGLRASSGWSCTLFAQWQTRQAVTAFARVLRSLVARVQGAAFRQWRWCVNAEKLAALGACVAPIYRYIY